MMTQTASVCNASVPVGYVGTSKANCLKVQLHEAFYFIHLELKWKQFIGFKLFSEPQANLCTHPLA